MDGDHLILGNKVHGRHHGFGTEGGNDKGIGFFVGDHLVNGHEGCMNRCARLAASRVCGHKFQGSFNPFILYKNPACSIDLINGQLHGKSSGFDEWLEKGRRQSQDNGFGLGKGP